MALTNLAGISERLRLATRGKSLLRIIVQMTVSGNMTCYRSFETSGNQTRD